MGYANRAARRAVERVGRGLHPCTKSRRAVQDPTSLRAALRARVGSDDGGGEEDVTAREMDDPSCRDRDPSRVAAFAHG